MAAPAPLMPNQVPASATPAVEPITALIRGLIRHTRNGIEFLRREAGGSDDAARPS